MATKGRKGVQGGDGEDASQSKLSSWVETTWKNISKRETLSILLGGAFFGGEGVWI